MLYSTSQVNELKKVIKTKKKKEKVYLALLCQIYNPLFLLFFFLYLLSAASYEDGCEASTCCIVGVALVSGAALAYGIDVICLCFSVVSTAKVTADIV